MLISRCNVTQAFKKPTNLSLELFAPDLQCLEDKPPFSVSVRGLVTCVQDEIVSQSGIPMRNFTLQDEAGRYVQCVVCGRHVDNDFLEERNEVILYFARALTGLNQRAGQLWMYDDSHIVLLDTRSTLPPSKISVELK